MLKKIDEIIQKYENIIIIRHTRPDLDALGSQFGLMYLLKDKYPSKKVLVDGDMNRPSFLGKMDEVTDDDYKKSLVILVDQAVYSQLNDKRIDLAKEVIIMDHHNCETDILNVTIHYKDITASSASQIITEFAISNNYIISKQAAFALYSGIIGDSNRFNFGLSTKLFNDVSILFDTDFDYQMIYNTIYQESLDHVKMKAYFIDKIQLFGKGVGFLINDLDVFSRFPVDLFSISRGMINTMANIKEIKIWASFTKDPESHKIFCEFRSRDVVILDIVKKLGGGGHNFACGATIESFDMVESILEEFNKLL